MKYRIIRRNKAPNGNRVTWYYAQMSVLGVWIDCALQPFSDTYNASDGNLSVVEKWVEDEIKVKTIFSEPLKEEVVKTYD